MDELLNGIDDIFGSVSNLNLIIFFATIALAIFSQSAFKGAFLKAKKQPNSRGVTGYQLAHKMLRDNGVYDVQIVPTRISIGDHFNPRTKTIALSPEIFNGRSVASLAIAAHEVGHALQWAKGYSMITVRNKLLPVAQISSNFAWVAIIFGILAASTNMLLAGIIMLGVMGLFQLVTLPIEFNASTRAKDYLKSNNILFGGTEITLTNKVLKAAAMTYVIGFVTTLLTMARLMLILMNNQRR